MSTLWTPGGERPIRREPPAISHRSARGRRGPGGPGGGAGPRGRRAQRGGAAGPRWTELRDQLARTPAEVVVANHAFGLFELAALHLSLQPPQLAQARLAIDALAALVDGLGEPARATPAPSCPTASASCAWRTCRSTRPAAGRRELRAVPGTPTERG